MEQQMRDLREIVDRIATELRAELEKGFKLGDSHLRDHIEQSFAQIGVALEAADKRVELAFQAAERLEVERVQNVATQMQEVIDNVTERIDNGDQGLREHIVAQVGQISSALDALRRETALAHKAADELEKTRVEELRASLDQKVARVQAELTLMHTASEKAITKQEQASEKRFEAVNEFRAQLSDQASMFLPREVAEAQFKDLQKRSDDHAAASRTLLPRDTFESTVIEWTAWRETVNRALSTVSAVGSEQRRNEDRMQPWQIWAMGAVLAIVVVVVNVIVATAGVR